MMDSLTYQLSDMNLFIPKTQAFISINGSLKYEKTRLGTFEGWNVSFMNPVDLAREGLYYLKCFDHCACIFCRGVIGAWEEGDIASDEHRRIFPKCPLYNSRIPTGNVPISHSRILDDLVLDGEDAPIPLPEVAENFSLLDDNFKFYRDMMTVQTTPATIMEFKKPIWNQYTNYESRLRCNEMINTRLDYNKTIKPPNIIVSQTSEILAEAGFFYRQLCDQYTCYQCNGGIRNWEPFDDPWELHARWFPGCQHVILCKGQEFIDKVQRARITRPSSGIFKPLSDDSLDVLMTGDIIVNLIYIGFDKDLVRRCLRRRIETYGFPFFSIEIAIKYVRQLMEEESNTTLGHFLEDECGSRFLDPNIVMNENGYGETYPYDNIEKHGSGGGGGEEEVSQSILLDCDHDKNMLDISDMKAKYLCSNCCLNRYRDVVLLPCKHTICKECLPRTNGICPRCMMSIECIITPIY